VEINQITEIPESVEKQQRKASAYRINKQAKLADAMDRRYIAYDEKTIKHLISQLEQSIKNAKLAQFEQRLNQQRTVPTINIADVEEKLTRKEKADLAVLVDKIGSIDSLKLMAIINNGITPDEQRKIYELFKEKLTDDEIIRLNDILGRYIES
jgi:glutaredoxin